MTDNEQKKIFAKNLSYYVHQSGKQQKEIANILHIPIQTFNGWCKGVSFPSMDKIQKLADYFRIGKSDLIDDKQDMSFSITDEEQNIIIIYRDLPQNEKEMLKRMILYYEKIKELKHQDEDLS